MPPGRFGAKAIGSPDCDPQTRYTPAPAAPTLHGVFTLTPDAIESLGVAKLALASSRHATAE
jgi:hypothetical protein